MDKEILLNIKKDIENRFKKETKLTFSEFIDINSHDIIKSSGMFDEDFYLSMYPDVEYSSFDSIDHYLKFGVDEKCNPNSYFDTSEYIQYFLKDNSDSINPLVHYILYGSENKNYYEIKLLEKEYKVSIIMPTYNRKNIISDSLDSIINQTFKNFEIIVVDDGSTDNTKDYVFNLYPDYINSKKIKYYTLNHKGVSYARNFGLKESSGNIIAYLDSDNQWDSEYLHTMLTNMYENKNADCAYCDVKVNNRVKNKTYTLNHKFNRKQLLKANFIDLNSFIHKKELYINKGGFDESLTRLVDWDLIIRYTENKNPLHVDEVLVNYIIDSKFNNITLTQPLENNFDRIHQKYWEELYEEEYDLIVDYFDQGFYLKEYGDVLKKGIHPIYHYLTVGHKENLNPNPDFITSFYKFKYPDIARNNINPLVHYAKSGEMEGRKINYFDDLNKILNNNLPYLSNYTFNNPPLVSIIILNKDGLNHLRILFKDFSKKTNYDNFEIIVVDNGSKDESVDFLKSLDELPITIIENKENVSFAKGNNDAVKISNGEYLLLLNNDIEPTYGWLNEMVGTMLYNENVGAVGAKLLYPFIENKNQNKYSFSIQHAGDIFRENINNGCLYEAHNQNKYLKDVFENSISMNRKCLLVTGAVLLTKKEIYNELGGLDEKYWYGYEDVDFNLRLYEAGYDVVFASAALLFHHESATPKKSRYLNNHQVLCEKWSKFLFKELLNDKIKNNCFFTDKKLNFMFVVNEHYSNKDLRNYVHDLTIFFNKEGYVSNMNLNFNLNIDAKVDVLISFTQDYDIKNIHARENIIKLLIITDDFDFDKNYDGWDIIVSKDMDIVNKFIKKNIDIPIFYHEDYLNLGENIISDLQETFLKEISGD